MILIRSVVLDLDGVVIPSGPSFEYFERFHGISRDDFRAFFQGPYRAAMVGEVDLFEVLGPMLLEWNWSGSEQDFADTWMRSCADADPDVLALISDLDNRGVRCYAATNQDHRRADYLDVLDWMGVFEGRFYSCRLGFRKPQPEYYDHILDHAGSRPDEMLFVDDKLENVQGARACGWHAEVCRGAAELSDILIKYTGTDATD